MLLTGFDCPRLKKLYLDREVRDHNLLQTLTRVNRPYKNLKYGYIVDFIDIQEEFDKTNKAYWDELNGIYGNEITDYYDSLFKNYDEMEKEIEEIKEKLWNYDTTNPEIFNNQLQQINDKKELYTIKKLLDTVKELYNIIKITDNNDLLNKLNFNNFKDLLKVTENRINFLTFKDSVNDFETQNLFNEAMEDYVFEMIKVDEQELQLVDNLRKIFRKTRVEFERNYDTQDPKYITLKQQLDSLVKDFDNITNVSNINDNIDKLNQIYNLIHQINIENDKILHKYEEDEKYSRIHKELMRENINMTDSQLYNGLIEVKHKIDKKLLSQDPLSNKSYFSSEVDNSIINSFENIDINLIDTIKYKIVNNYISG